MLPFHKILCPTDFSEASYAALDKAGELALHFGAELCLVHVVHLPPLTNEMGIAPYGVLEAEQEALSHADLRLRELLLSRVPQGVKAKHVVRLGAAADKIVQAAASEGADLIVLSTHGLTGWRHLVFGSEAERVVQTAHCAVLTVRAPQTTAAPRRSVDEVPGRDEPKELIPKELMLEEAPAAWPARGQQRESHSDLRKT